MKEPEQQAETTAQKTGLEGLSQNSSQPSTTEGPTHFDALLDVPDPVQEPEYSSEMVSEDDFHSLFVMCFTMGEATTGLKSLHVEEEDGKAKMASKAIYETIREIPAFQFLLNPGGKWGQRVFAIGLFTFPMVQAVRAELALRNKQVAAAVASAAAPQGKQADLSAFPA